MTTSFEQIKDASQLQEYLLKHAASGQAGSINVKSKDASPVANDYMGMKRLRATNPRRAAVASSSPPKNLTDRYEKR
jgi:hypothetical protein